MHLQLVTLERKTLNLDILCSTTFVKKQPSTDFIVMMHPSDMKKLNIKDNDYVKIESIIYKKQQQEEEKNEDKIELLGLVINSLHKYSKSESLFVALTLQQRRE